MGYLDNSTLTVDAILTKKGRQLLSEGTLEITKFALVVCWFVGSFRIRSHRSLTVC